MSAFGSHWGKRKDVFEVIIKTASYGLADVMTTGKSDGANSSVKGSRAQPKRSQIDESLKRVYDDMLDDSVPDRFEELLRRLREQDSKK
ncbi:MAG TPA: NepR family anti-sigma factor [Roseovarius sp.]